MITSSAGSVTHGTARKGRSCFFARQFSLCASHPSTAWWGSRDDVRNWLDRRLLRKLRACRSPFSRSSLFLSDTKDEISDAQPDSLASLQVRHCRSPDRCCFVVV